MLSIKSIAKELGQIILAFIVSYLVFFLIYTFFFVIILISPKFDSFIPDIVYTGDFVLLYPFCGGIVLSILHLIYRKIFKLHEKIPSNT